MKVSQRIQHLIGLKKMKKAQKLFDKAVEFSIDGRNAVHWTELTQLAPYTVSGLATTHWQAYDSASGHFPLAKLVEGTHQMFESDLKAILFETNLKANSRPHLPLTWGHDGTIQDAIERGSWTTLPLLQNMEWNEKHCAVAVTICRLLRDRPELMGRPPLYQGF